MPRVGLDSSQVVEAAAEIIDEHGAEALTLSALARRLGVKSPSLYGHVSGLEDLRERLATRAARELGERLAPAATGWSRGEARLALGRAYRDWALEHPGQYAAIESGRRGSEPAVQRVLDL